MGGFLLSIDLLVAIVHLTRVKSCWWPSVGHRLRRPETNDLAKRHLLRLAIFKHKIIQELFGSENIIERGQKTNDGKSSHFLFYPISVQLIAFHT